MEESRSSLALSLHTTALDYVLDGDTDRRLRGQVPRVTFLNHGPDDPKHQASGTVWLKHQHDRVCGDSMFQLQVETGSWPLEWSSLFLHALSCFCASTVSACSGI